METCNQQYQIEPEEIPTTIEPCSVPETRAVLSHAWYEMADELIAEANKELALVDRYRSWIRPQLWHKCLPMRKHAQTAGALLEQAAICTQHATRCIREAARDVEYVLARAA